MINVTRTFLPPLEEYVGHLERVWRSGQVTNNGPLQRELEQRLKEYLGARHVLFVANGTLGLQIALRALGVTRKVVTTPFSYVASTGAILWEHATPVFADIDAGTFCIDPAKVESAIDDETDAILAVHVYGHPCDVAALDAIARRRNVRLIYDAAHAFGCRLHGRALATYGDVSVLSFHATKLFHTIEGGAVVTNDDELARKVRLHRAFGHVHDDHITVGTNAKNSELHAAMGLCMLPRVPELIRLRQTLCAEYARLFADLPLGRPPAPSPALDYNWAYCPVTLPSEAALLSVKAALEQAGIGPRRYFYPPLNRLPYRKGEACPIAESLSVRILCLPLSHEITADMQRTIADVMRRALV